MPQSLPEIPVLKIIHDVRNYNMGSQDTNSACLARKNTMEPFPLVPTYAFRCSRTSRKFKKCLVPSYSCRNFQMSGKAPQGTKGAGNPKKYHETGSDDERRRCWGPHCPPNSVPGPGPSPATDCVRSLKALCSTLSSKPGPLQQSLL